MFSWKCSDVLKGRVYLLQSPVCRLSILDRVHGTCIMRTASRPIKVFNFLCSSTSIYNLSVRLSANLLPIFFSAGDEGIELEINIWLCRKHLEVKTEFPHYWFTFYWIIHYKDLDWVSLLIYLFLFIYFFILHWRNICILRWILYMTFLRKLWINIPCICPFSWLKYDLGQIDRISFLYSYPRHENINLKYHI
jgi:hypothetical protein